MLKIFSLTLAIIGFIFFSALITGYVIGPDYSGEETMIVNYSVNEVWSVLNEIDKIPEDNPKIVSVDILGKYLNLYAWEEKLKNGGFRKYRQNSKEENEKMIIEMTGSSYGVTGIWEFILEPQNNDTKITIIEKSNNISIVGRGARYYFGRNEETARWAKFIRVRLFKRLLTTN